MSINQQTDKEKMWYIYIIESYSAVKKMKFLGKLMELEKRIVLNEVI